MTDPYRVVPLEAPPNCTVAVPGSKSITNRALITAALAPGVSRLENVLVADDTEAMIGALTELGIDVDLDSSVARATVHGKGGAIDSASLVIDARQSGTTGRFVSALAALGSSPVVVDGHQQLRARPINDLVVALRALGVVVDELREKGRLPLRITGPILEDHVSMPGGVSSQFVSALMMAGAMPGLSISLTTDPVSRPYLDMTASVMRAFGASADVSDRTWTVHGGYVPVDGYMIEPDASAASYFFAAAAITGGRVRVDGLGLSSTQGDLEFVKVLEQMGAHVTIADDHTVVTGGELHGIDVDMRHISDTAPTMAVVAAFADGPTTVTGIGFVRGKESDRIAGPIDQLGRCGVIGRVESDGFTITPKQMPHGASIETYDDHRMAMAFSILGLRTPGIEIRDPECVRKTFPGYFDTLDELR